VCPCVFLANKDF